MPVPVGRRFVRGWWFVIGLLAVGIGALAIVVPGLPSTMFFVFAAWCFSRSSPRFERWVLELPSIGPMVRDYRAGLGMPRRAKVLAMTMMWSAMLLSAWLTRERLFFAGTIVAAGLVGSYVVLWRVPTRTDSVVRPAVDDAAS
jgi:hypothetical protein